MLTRNLVGILKFGGLSLDRSSGPPDSEWRGPERPRRRAARSVQQHCGCCCCLLPPVGELTERRVIDLETCEGAQLEEELVVKEVKNWEEWLEKQLLDNQDCQDKGSKLTKGTLWN